MTQFRSDPEFEEARIDHLEDLVLQLQDRIEKLESHSETEATPRDSKPDPAPDYFKPCEFCGNSTPMTAWCCDTAAKEAQNEALPGYQIAKAIKAME